MKYKNIIKVIAAGLSVLLVSCGEGTVEVGPETYTPKIVVEGFLQPGKIPADFIITRNVALNTEVNPLSAVLADADVVITDLQSNISYKLTYNPGKYKFDYNGNDLVIGFGKSYRLDVSAAIDGKPLKASSVTRVPSEGFRILEDESLFGTMKYRELDDLGNVKEFKVVFNPCTGSDFYALSNVALDADLDNFVYDNPYFEIKREDLEKDFSQYKFQMDWRQNVNPEGGKRSIVIDWLDLWFYSNYRFIVYAGDENFRLYLQTHGNVQEFDGNFHEPRLNISGDGIGVFASYIADTVYARVEK